MAYTTTVNLVLVSMRMGAVLFPAFGNFTIAERGSD